MLWHLKKKHLQNLKSDSNPEPDPDSVWNAYTSNKEIYQIRYCIMHSAHLPTVTVVVGVTIEPLKEGKKVVSRRYVLLVKRFGVLDSVAT